MQFSLKTFLCSAKKKKTWQNKDTYPVTVADNIAWLELKMLRFSVYIFPVASKPQNNMENNNKSGTRIKQNHLPFFSFSLISFFFLCGPVHALWFRPIKRMFSSAMCLLKEVWVYTGRDRVVESTRRRWCGDRSCSLPSPLVPVCLHLLLLTPLRSSKPGNKGENKVWNVARTAVQVWATVHQKP